MAPPKYMIEIKLPPHDFVNALTWCNKNVGVISKSFTSVSKYLNWNYRLCSVNQDVYLFYFYDIEDKIAFDLAWSYNYTTNV